MPNRLLERLGQDYTNLFDRYDAILNRCHAENRDPNGGEEVELDQLRSDMTPLGDRIVQLRDDEDRRASTVVALTRDSGVTPMAHAGQGGMVEDRPRPSPLICSDQMLRSIMQAVQSRTAFDQPIDGIHLRATATVPATAIVPDWMVPVPFGREPRIAEHVTNAGGIGSEADWLEVTPRRWQRSCPKASPSPTRA